MPTPDGNVHVGEGRMLLELKLRNYRGFREHSVSLRPVTVAVGRNNAGKSTIIEALRIVSAVTNRLPHLSVKPVPEWLTIPKVDVGVAPALNRAGLNLESLFNGYGDPPAEITALFSSGTAITAYLGPEARIHAVVRDSKGNVVGKGGKGARITEIEALPQLGPVALEEKILVPDYVRSALSSPLASIHFRNQLNLLRPRFRDFKALAESSWPGLRVVELEGRGKLPGARLALFVKDSDFEAEIAWMGHGLQMWLQTMWFLTRVPKTSCVVLDEPDVYMHPDLQRRVFRLVRQRFAQVIIATHSVEIMQEADPASILVIDRRHPSSRFADSQPAVQRLVEQIGSLSHIQLSRLWHAKKCLMVEGEDLSILAILHHTLFPESDAPLETLPCVPLGGWGGWAYAVGSTLLVKNAVGDDVIPYCLFDSDYHTPDEISARINDAKARKVRLHVWNRKELENYLVVPATIARVIKTKTNGAYNPPEEEVAAKIDELASALRGVAFSAYGQAFLAQDRAGGFAKATERANVILDAFWGTPDGRAARACGKDLISGLSVWAQERFGVSFGPAALAREIRANEICDEARRVLIAIESGQEFPAAEHEVVNKPVQHKLALVAVEKS